jgi:hypothetical protein
MTEVEPLSESLAKLPFLCRGAGFSRELKFEAVMSYRTWASFRPLGYLFSSTKWGKL